MHGVTTKVSCYVTFHCKAEKQEVGLPRQKITARKTESLIWLFVAHYHYSCPEEHKTRSKKPLPRRRKRNSAHNLAISDRYYIEPPCSQADEIDMTNHL